MDNPRDTDDTQRSAPSSPSPSSARRQLGRQLKALRESCGLRLEDAGIAVQRSAPTMSRIEAGSGAAPRLIEIAALLDHYARSTPNVVTPEIREQLLRLAFDGRKKQWYEPFRPLLSGPMMADGVRRYVEYESDAAEIRNYEPELFPGLLQTRAYALAVAHVFYPDASRSQQEQFADFRIARQRVLDRATQPLRLYAAVSESALRRRVGGSAVVREQLSVFLDALRGQRENIAAYVISQNVIVPAAIGGSFVHLSMTDDGDDLVYLETRSGADYLEDLADCERFKGHFDSLVEVALSESDAIAVVSRELDNLADVEGRGSSDPN